MCNFSTVKRIALITVIQLLSLNFQSISSTDADDPTLDTSRMNHFLNPGKKKKDKPFWAEDDDSELFGMYLF